MQVITVQDSAILGEREYIYALISVEGNSVDSLPSFKATNRMKSGMMDINVALFYLKHVVRRSTSRQEYRVSRS